MVTWVNNRDSTGLYVASAITPFKTTFLPEITTEIFREIGHTSLKPDASLKRLKCHNILVIGCSTKKYECCYAPRTQYGRVLKFAGQNMFFPFCVSDYFGFSTQLVYLQAHLIYLEYM